MVDVRKMFKCCRKIHLTLLEMLKGRCIILLCLKERVVGRFVCTRGGDKMPGITPSEWVKIVGASILSLVRMKRSLSIF